MRPKRWHWSWKNIPDLHHLATRVSLCLRGRWKCEGDENAKREPKSEKQKTKNKNPKKAKSYMKIETTDYYINIIPIYSAMAPLQFTPWERESEAIITHFFPITPKQNPPSLLHLRTLSLSSSSLPISNPRNF